MRNPLSGWLAMTLLAPTAVAQHLDVLVFDVGGRVAVGAFDVEQSTAREERVFPARFDEFYAVNSPGFIARPGDLPGSADLQWDFLPATVDSGPHAGHTSTLLHWDPDTSPTPEFGPTPSAHSLTLFGKDGDSAAADGGEAEVPGHTIETTAPNGAIHEHRFFFLDDNGDGQNTTLPAAGIYLLAMQLRIDGMERSAPFFLVWATPESSVSPAIQPAVAWVSERVDTLIVDSSPMLGDFDLDEDVDGDDFLAWQSGFGIEAGAALGDGDADGDGDVDGDDFLVWQAHFAVGSGGATPTAAGGERPGWPAAHDVTGVLATASQRVAAASHISALPIPEPASAHLLVSVVTALCVRCGRRPGSPSHE